MGKKCKAICGERNLYGNMNEHSFTFSQFYHTSTPLSIPRVDFWGERGTLGDEKYFSLTMRAAGGEIYKWGGSRTAL